MHRQSRTPCDAFDKKYSLVSRLSIAILSSMLLGITFSSSLSEWTQSCAGILAALGILFCCCRALVARRSHNASFATIRRRRERRLDVLIGKLRAPVAGRTSLTLLPSS